MARIVQKFGGTSVGSTDRIRKVAERIEATRADGHEVVVVVSARSGVTNELLSRARELNPEPSRREMDMLLAVGEQETIALTAMALHAKGIPAISRTGAQAGILTDSQHTRARIIKINTENIVQPLAEKKVVIVAGFQGIDPHGQITTLGRGGSDLSAIALACVLNADLCQIFTDVDGVYTADPRIVPDARKLPVISYDEMLELASMGSKVMQSRSVEFAKKFGVVFEVRSSFNTNPGTIVKEEAPSMEDVVVRGVALDKNQIKVTISGIPDIPGTAASYFQALAEAGVVVDMIVQNIGRKGKANLTFTVTTEDAETARQTVEKLKQGEDFQVTVEGPVAKLSVVGVGMRTHSGVASTLFQALAKENINIQLISTSEIKISVVIGSENAEHAVRSVHAAFGLDKDVFPRPEIGSSPA